jgi:hypothetical protein
MWDGHSCPCDTYGLDRDDLPVGGIFTTTLCPKHREESDGRNI